MDGFARTRAGSLVLAQDFVFSALVCGVGTEDAEFRGLILTGFSAGFMPVEPVFSDSAGIGSDSVWFTRLGLSALIFSIRRSSCFPRSVSFGGLVSGLWSATGSSLPQAEGTPLLDPPALA